MIISITDPTNRYELKNKQKTVWEDFFEPLKHEGKKKHKDVRFAHSDKKGMTYGCSPKGFDPQSRQRRHVGRM
jgi:hypothetical protein